MKYTEYQFLIFSQLFYIIMNDCVEDAPYDLTHPIVSNELTKFLDSDFNDENKSEYDCMEDYINAHSDTISIQIADHCNL